MFSLSKESSTIFLENMKILPLNYFPIIRSNFLQSCLRLQEEPCHTKSLKVGASLTLVNADQVPYEERLIRERPALGELLVELRVCERDLSVDVLVQHEREHGQHRVNRGITDHQEALVQRHGREVEHRGEDCLHCRDDQP